jgi:hypothetical protein
VLFRFASARGAQVIDEHKKSHAGGLRVVWSSQPANQQVYRFSLALT